MMLRKIQLLFVIALVVLSFGALSGSVLAQGTRVPRAECPTSVVVLLGLGVCDKVYPWNQICFRSDSAIERTNRGDFKDVWGENFVAENCDGCPEDKPSPKDDRKNLKVEYTEVVTVTLADSTMRGAEFVKSILEYSIGHHDARELKESFYCGDRALPGCKSLPFHAIAYATEGIVKEMKHRYRWEITVSHVPKHGPDFNDIRQRAVYTFLYHIWGCSYCGKRPSYHPYTIHRTAPTTTSTVTGSTYHSFRGCVRGYMEDCP